jgi:hypothetical protein
MDEMADATSKVGRDTTENIDSEVAPRKQLSREDGQLLLVDASTKETATRERRPGKFDSETPSVIPTSLADQDLAVYGNLNTLLADAFTAKVEAAISEGVDSLPLLDGSNCYRGKSLSSLDDENEPGSIEKSPKERLWDALRYRFVRNVDVLEAYCAHHVLTLRKHPPARRKRIVAVVRDGFEALPPLPSKDYGDDKGETPSHKYPTRSELPSEEERTNLVDELSCLKVDLEAAKTRRNALLASAESARRAEQAVAGVAATVEANLPTLEQDAIRKDVTRKVEQGNTVGLLADEAKALIGKLDGIKRDRSKKQQQTDNDNDDAAYDFVQRDDPLYKASNRIGNKRHKPLSLEESYRRDRRDLGLLRDSTNETGNGGHSIGPTPTAIKAMLLMAPSSSSTTRSSLPRTPSRN